MHRFVGATVFDRLPERDLAQGKGGYYQDLLYAYQIVATYPFALDETSFYIAKLVSNERTSRRVYRNLLESQVLGEDGQVDTTKIGPKFAHQVAVLDTGRQKALVNLLFWWEEECQRLRKLKAEERELSEMITERASSSEDSSGGERSDRIKFARERVRMKIRQLPSERQPEIENDQDDVAAAFDGRRESIIASTNNLESSRNPEKLPVYRA